MARTTKQGRSAASPTIGAAEPRTVVVAGPETLVRRVQALHLPRTAVMPAPHGAALDRSLRKRSGPTAVLAAAGDDGNAPDLEGRPAGPSAPPLVLLTADHRLVPATGLHLGDGVCLLRDDATDDALRAALEAALDAALDAEPPAPAVPGREGLHLEADWAQVIAHDLRAPLGINNGYADLLLGGDEPLAPDVRAIVQRMRENGEWMLRLVDGLLDVGMVRHDAVRLAVVPTALGDLLDGVARQMERLAGMHGVRIACTPAAERDRFGIDRTRVEQVLHNLVANAVRFAPAGSVVELEAQADGTLLRFQVSDQGRGMSPAEADAAFDKFASDGRGRGLGLAIARAIVTLHGGRIWVESAPGRGSRFRFTIAATHREPPAPEAPQPAGDRPDAP